MDRKELTREQAIALANTKWWEGMASRDVALFQLFNDKLCMPFDLFQKAVEKTLDRPVFTHEFGLSPDRLRAEILGKVDAPSFEEIMSLIPKEKRLAIFT